MPHPALGRKEKLPRRAGSYLLERVLGIGGMGEVYLGRDEAGSPVALKRLPAEAAEDQGLRRRFQLEAEAARQLDHPAIVKVFEIFEDDQGHWIVMEYAEGETLHELIENHGPLTPERLRALVRQIAAGLAVAHDKGIVHRDLKTENIVVTPQGEAKILDFGLAKHLLGGDGGPTLTTAGTLLGTCRSMSPEQALAEEVVDARSDLFSLGVLMYEALTGASPFAAETPLQTISILVSQPHRPVRQRNPRVPPELAELIDRLLCKEKKDRPQSAREVVEILDRIAPPPAAWRAAVAWLGSRWSRRGRA